MLLLTYCLDNKSKEALTDPLMKNNPISLQVLGICSALAVTVQLNTAVVMTLAVVSVLSISNTVISVLRKMIPRYHFTKNRDHSIRY